MDIVVMDSLIKMIVHFKDHKNVHMYKHHHQLVLIAQLMPVHNHLIKHIQY